MVFFFNFIGSTENYPTFEAVFFMKSTKIKVSVHCRICTKYLLSIKLTSDKTTYQFWLKDILGWAKIG